MNTPEDTFRALKKLPFIDVYEKFVNKRVTLEEKIQFIKNSDWELNEFIGQCQIYQRTLAVIRCKV